VQHPRQAEVFEERTIAGQQARILKALDPFTEEPFCRHASDLREYEMIGIWCLECLPGAEFLSHAP
jgi:hypothetical protein